MDFIKLHTLPLFEFRAEEKIKIIPKTAAMFKVNWCQLVQIDIRSLLNAKNMKISFKKGEFHNSHINH